MPEAADHVRLPLQPPLIFLGHLASAIVLQWLVPIGLPWPLPLRILGAILLLAGVALGFSSLREMRRAHTTPDPHEPASALVTTGPYSFSRNPIYLGFLLSYLGFTLLAGTLWGVLLAPFLVGTVTRAIIRNEEAYLEQKFQEPYRVYRSLVRRWI